MAAGSATPAPGGQGGVLTDPAQAADGGMDSSDFENPAKKDDEDPEDEELEVRNFWKEYNQAREFDENFRKQVAIDRRYAAGTANPGWAVDTNLIGTFIDILVALLYAKDPDTSVNKAQQVVEDDTMPLDQFALTLQIVVSRMWKDGRLKKAMKKVVRSVLSNGEGWFKAVLIGHKTPQPEVEAELNDTRATIERLQAMQDLIEDPDDMDPDERQKVIDEQQYLMETLQAKIEVITKYEMVFDFIKTENIQVSTDVECISDYCEADWIANEIFVAKKDALARFPKLKTRDLKFAKQYYQLQPRGTNTKDLDGILPQGNLTAEQASSFSEASQGNESVPFVRVVEMWKRTDKHIFTAIDGVKLWAKKPFTDKYPTKRFYPYFFVSFYEVDAMRHPQSLSFRMYKLQDEYSTTRSNFRIARERSIAGVMFNASQIDDVQAKKISDAKEQEFIPVRPADPDTPLANIFIAKPTGAIDMRVFDPSLILNDMERVSGIQEALSSAIASGGNPKTATEANIQQSGTAARTNADRDAEEDALTELAVWTAETTLQCLSVQTVERIAGESAVWFGPDDDTQKPGMALEDLFSLVEVSIAAGSTGKPRSQLDQQAWAQILPLIHQYVGEIVQALATGNKPLADALKALIDETMKRMGDTEDSSRFIPKTPPPGSPGAGAPPQQQKPVVSVSLRGELDPATAALLVKPDLPAPPAPTPGASPPGGSPAAPSQPTPGANVEPPA